MNLVGLTWGACVSLQESGRSSWERPLEYESPRFDGQMVVMSGNDGWTKHYDETNATYFYFNEVRHAPGPFVCLRRLMTASHADSFALGLTPCVAAPCC